MESFKKLSKFILAAMLFTLAIPAVAEIEAEAYGPPLRDGVTRVLINDQPVTTRMYFEQVNTILGGNGVVTKFESDDCVGYLNIRVNYDANKWVNLEYSSIGSGEKIYFNGRVNPAQMVSAQADVTIFLGAESLITNRLQVGDFIISPNLKIKEFARMFPLSMQDNFISGEQNDVQTYIVVFNSSQEHLESDMREFENYMGFIPTLRFSFKNRQLLAVSIEPGCSCC